jgi:hypothetical protein
LRTKHGSSNSRGVALTLLTAILTSAVFAVPGFPVAYYACWLSWAKLNGSLGVLVYLAIAGAGGGFIGWEAAQLSHAQPSSNRIVNGIFFGAAGAALLRADFSRANRSRSSASDGKQSQLTDAVSLLAAFIRWAEQLLNHVAQRAAETWYNGRTDQVLGAEGRRLNDIILRTKLTDTIKKRLQADLVPAMEAMSDPLRHDDGRVRLIGFCVYFNLGQHLPKPRQV